MALRWCLVGMMLFAFGQLVHPTGGYVVMVGVCVWMVARETMGVVVERVEQIPSDTVERRRRDRESRGF